MTAFSQTSSATCPSCHDPAREPSRLWQRRHPGYVTLRLCEPCNEEAAKRADDRSYDPGDEIRLAGLYITLAGETWVHGDRMFWFRTPLLAHATHVGTRNGDEQNSAPPPRMVPIVRPAK